MTVPNAITLLRIALVPVFMLSMSMEWRIAALVIFSAAAATDLLDGYLARKLDQVSNFGKFADPLADKLLVLAALAYFLAEGTVPAWVVVLVLAREFIISSLRMVAAAGGVVIAAGLSGKIKTTVQIFCIIAILTPWYRTQMAGGVTLYAAAAWLVAAVTLWSGLDYLIRHRAVLKENL
jgi:CDP-diacylglycerol--glycerol-3-phosphate 3-phosphatidyltransferase